MSIVSNRVQDVNRTTNKMHRLESDLEAGAMAMFMCDRTVKDIQTQFGPVYFLKEGKWYAHYFDFCVDYHSGCRTLYAVRHDERSKQLEIDIDLISQQDLKSHAHFAYVLTEDEISKPVVYRSNRILRARWMNNENNNEKVWQAMVKLGGRQAMANVLLESGITFSHAEEALWALHDRGLIKHDHRDADRLILKRHSMIRVVKGARYERP